MKIIKIIGEKELRITVPADEWEMSYSQCLDFLKAEQKYFDINRETTSIANTIAIEMLCESLRQAGVTIEGGTLLDIPLTVDDELPGQCGSIYDDISIFRLYQHIGEISSYKPENIEKTYSFDYKGEMYYVEQNRALRLMDRTKAYTLGEVIEVEDVKRLFGGHIKEQGDPNGEYEFEMLLRVLAVLARKEQEELSHINHERQAWIEERARHFISVPLAPIRDITFFLIATLNEFQKTHTDTDFGKELTLDSLTHF